MSVVLNMLEKSADFFRSFKKVDKYFGLGLVALGVAIVVIPFVSSTFAPMIAFVSVGGFLVSGANKWNLEG